MASERGLDHLEAAGENADDVEPQGAGPAAGEVEVAAREGPQPALLGWGDGLGRDAEPIGAAGLVRPTSAVGPIDAIEALTPDAPDPTGDGGDPHAELAGDGTQGLASSDRGYHLSATRRLTL